MDRKSGEEHLWQRAFELGPYAETKSFSCVREFAPEFTVQLNKNYDSTAIFKNSHLPFIPDEIKWDGKIFTVKK